MTTQNAPVLLNVDGRVATLTLNRPEVLNAMDVPMLREIVERLKEVESNDAVDVLVLTGSGRGFSAGGDIKSMLSSTDESAFLPVMETISEMMITLYSLPKLVISAIHGPAAGLGLSFALAADYIFAEKQSKLAMNFIGIGLIPDGGGHFFLERRLGETKTKQVIWEGKTMGADEAFSLGLVDQLVEVELQNAVSEKINEWLHKPVKAMVKTKAILADANKQKLLNVLELEKYGQQEMRSTKDHREGVQAFLEKRRPNFTGK
ncbi:enoyl-CoA hydratase [Bacillus luteolus]|uniref:Enoyl-CoA hydratase n=1 Tax=Litchfieldia luteola TaxID=682179 RepID=A0ABR9QE83_9BACI|nr:enoyl-CoA hydratase [Cytobacillus luteolus]MBE4906763.1 enoyl-CoA hydratase [Cytobacillus luteolus]MBP1940586.1 enoyl-CoA hydratase/carnithine racemase [Cytobacillus luteolus]